MKDYDIVIIGAGIAGASAAYHLASDRRVALVEQEALPGYHTTGRSAALYSKTYGPGTIRAFSRASEQFFDAPPDGFAPHALLTPRDVIFIGRSEQLPSLDAMEWEHAGSGNLERLSARDTEKLFPLLRKNYCAGSLLDRSSSDIDVNALHRGYLAGFKARGGELHTDARVEGLARAGKRWNVEAGQHRFGAETVVNAAGAWADHVGALAGASPIGLVPKRRTALLIDAPGNVIQSCNAMVCDVDEEFYLKPESGRLLISPADETPSAPCDAQPEEMDIAICVDRIEQAFEIKVRRIDNKWAGLRSFVADGDPVAGYDTNLPGFFWLAGQGGYGIQTAPALSETAAALVRGLPIPASVAEHGVSIADLSPKRIAVAA